MDNLIDRDNWIDVIAQDAARIAFGKPVLMNTHRAIVAEAIVARALSDRWRHCGSDWNAFDFARDDGVALEVKQSAARQSWAGSEDKPSRSSFDIAVRKRRYVDDRWVKERRRWADLYVFAHHPCTAADTDHRQPHQWIFYVAREVDLPVQQTLSLNGVIRLSVPSSFADLSKTINVFADQLAL